MKGDLHSQFEGFVAFGNETKMQCLIKSLFGLKQTPFVWYKFFDKYFKSKVSSMFF
jgi:hypothetical protein